MPTNVLHGPWSSDDVETFRRSVREFIRREFVPQQQRWREQHGPSFEDWRAAGRVGILLPDFDTEFACGGGTYAHQAVVLEELIQAGVHFGCIAHGIVAHYIAVYGSVAQKRSWLVPMARGELVGAVAMTEPDAGSDLQAIRTTARRDGDHYVINGSKNFITNARNAGLVCVAVKTDTNVAGMRGISLIIVEIAHVRGYHVGKPLEKVGMHAQDTCQIFFEDVRVPATNLLGNAEGRGFSQMMAQLPYERLSIAVMAVASAERALALTIRHAKERRAFGKPLFDLQNTRFKLADCATRTRIGRVFLDRCIERYIAGQLDDASAAMAKYWLTDNECQVIDECVQLHGGYGYMTEYPIAQMWADSRVQRIYGGTNEIMKELIAWTL